MAQAELSMVDRESLEDGLTIIRVKHNMEMAHRLYLTPGKCERIHGHSWWANLSIGGKLDDTGKVVEFGATKKRFRAFLDEYFDHHLLLNQEDPIYKEMTKLNVGVEAFDKDPTTENIARYIHEWAQLEFGQNFVYRVTLQETSVNFASVGDLRL